jgi:hypothetical protein
MGSERLGWAPARYLALGRSIGASVQTFHSGPGAWLNPLVGLNLSTGRMGRKKGASPASLSSYPKHRFNCVQPCCCSSLMPCECPAASIAAREHENCSSVLANGVAADHCHSRGVVFGKNLPFASRIGCALLTVKCAPTR